MTAKKLFILTLIFTSGVSLFSLFYILFEREIAQMNPTSTAPVATNLTPSKTTTSQSSLPANIQKSTTTPSITTTQTPTTSTVTSQKSSGVSSSQTPVVAETVKTPVVAPVTPAPIQKSTTTKYKDGDFSSTINYSVPRNTETITVNLSISNDKVTNVSQDMTMSRGDSRAYQQGFASAISGEVVGKKLDSIDLNSVNGASRTTEAFMQALEKIKTEAKS